MSTVKKRPTRESKKLSTTSCEEAEIILISLELEATHPDYPK
jgi:hypothetical protein